MRLTEDLTITVELVSHRKYSITLNGEGFTVEGKLTDIEKGEDVTLTFTLNEGKDMIRLNEYTLLDNLTYTIEDIQEDIEYDVYTTDYVNALYWIQSWNDEGAYQEYAESKFDITSAAPKIDANYVKGLVWEIKTKLPQYSYRTHGIVKNTKSGCEIFPISRSQ